MRHQHWRRKCLNELPPAIGSSLAVFGTGAVGSAAAMAARVAHWAIVVAVDIHDSRLELARELGATHTANSRSESVTGASVRSGPDERIRRQCARRDAAKPPGH